MWGENYQCHHKSHYHPTAHAVIITPIALVSSGCENKAHLTKYHKQKTFIQKVLEIDQFKTKLLAYDMSEIILPAVQIDGGLLVV